MQLVLVVKIRVRQGDQVTLVMVVQQELELLVDKVLMKGRDKLFLVEPLIRVLKVVDMVVLQIVMVLDLLDMEQVLELVDMLV